MQQILPLLIFFKSSQHVSGDKFAHPQELFLTVHTAFGTMHGLCSRMYSQKVLLRMGEFVARNMLGCFKKINKRKSCCILLVIYFDVQICYLKFCISFYCRRLLNSDRKISLLNKPTRSSWVVTFISLLDYSTCFGRFLHPSSGVWQLYMQPLVRVTHRTTTFLRGRERTPCHVGR